MLKEYTYKEIFYIIFILNWFKFIKN
jgi:hypothetical protein